MTFALEALRDELAPDTLLAAVQRAWPEVAGRTIAEETEPVSAREGAVTVACRSATWAHELELLSSDLRGALNVRLGADSVRRLRFVVRDP